MIKPVNVYNDAEESILDTAPVFQYDCSLKDTESSQSDKS